MPHSIQLLLEPLLCPEKSAGRRLVFSWRLIRRHGRPLLLLPENSMAPDTALELYSAHRHRAKAWRKAIPRILRSPAASIFPRITLEADADSQFMRFLSEQSGVPVEELRAPAIKFGGFGEKKIRLALLVCDQTNRPVKVIKVGLGEAGRSVTERETSLLALLPPDVIGCIRMSGQCATEDWLAFATPFYRGDSPENDAGMEIVFQSWLNPGELSALDEFDAWRGLEKAIPAADQGKFSVLASVLAGQKFHSTLYHGDFAPWNLRALNVMDLQAYDWEAGSLRGIPAWDWFHFFVQTSILVKRHSPARVAAELDQLIQSPRFVKYARSAGIERLVEPLLLAYLLHHEHVVRPLEGRAMTRQLFEFFWFNWQHGHGQASHEASRTLPGTGRPTTAAPGSATMQIGAAVSGLMNLFWRPSLSHKPQRSILKEAEHHWRKLLGCLVWIVMVAQLPLTTNPHLMFAPFYLVPCIYMALRTDRRLASLVAFISAFGGPLLLYWGNSTFAPLSIILWNGLMRYIVFQIVVVLFDCIRRQGVWHPRKSPGEDPNPIQAIAGNWAIILLAMLFLLVIVSADLVTGANILMTGLYIIPCMVMTLALGWRWGTVFAILCSVIGPMLQRPDPAYQPLDIQFWNTVMRLIMYQMAVVMIDRIRRKNILFSRPSRVESAANQ